MTDPQKKAHSTAELRTLIHHMRDACRRAADALRGTGLGAELSSLVEDTEWGDVSRAAQRAWERARRVKEYESITQALRDGRVSPNIGAQVAADLSADLDAAPSELPVLQLAALQEVWPRTWSRHALAAALLPGIWETDQAQIRRDLRKLHELLFVPEYKAYMEKLQAWARTEDALRHPWHSELKLSTVLGETTAPSTPDVVRFLRSMRTYSSALRDFEVEAYLGSSLIRRTMMLPPETSRAQKRGRAAAPTDGREDVWLPTYESRRQALRLMAEEACLLCGAQWNQSTPGICARCADIGDRRAVTASRMTYAYLSGLNPTPAHTDDMVVQHRAAMLLADRAIAHILTRLEAADRASGGRLSAPTSEHTDYPTLDPASLRGLTVPHKVVSLKPLGSTEQMCMWVRVLPQLDGAVGAGVELCVWEDKVYARLTFNHLPNVG